MIEPAGAPATVGGDSGRPVPVPDSSWYSASARRQWRLVFVLLVMGSLGAIDRQVITLLVNPIRETLRITDVQISLIVGAAFALSNTLFTLPAGFFADRVSRRGLIACGPSCGRVSRSPARKWSRADSICWPKPTEPLPWRSRSPTERHRSAQKFTVRLAP